VNFSRIILIFAARRMKVFFEKEYLLELYRDGKTRDKHHRYQPSIVKKYQRIVRYMAGAKDITELWTTSSLHYEKLWGDKEGLSSVRVNDKYRIEFREETEDGKIFATLCTITELSNHYR
jgi:proteic killer suppression protein